MHQQSSINRYSGGHRALLLMAIVLSLLASAMASYQPSLAAQRGDEKEPQGRNTARPTAGSVTMTKTADVSQIAPGGTINYSVSIHNGFTATITVNTFTDEYTAGGGNVSTNVATPGWITCDDPGGGSNLTCSNGTIAAGGDQTINFSAVVHGDAPDQTALTDQASMSYRVAGEPDDRGAFSGPRTVTVIGGGPAPTNTTAPPPPPTDTPVGQPTNPAPTPTDTPVLGQPTLPPAPTNPPANTPAPPQPTEQGRDDEGGCRGRGCDNGGQPTATAAAAQNGLIFGIIVRGNNPAPNLPVTLHLKQGEGDTQVGTATTDANGRYSFAGLPSTLAGGGYYVYFASSAAGDLSQWFTYQVSYTAGDTKQLATFDIADLQLVNQSRDVLRGNITFNIVRRYASETYLLRFAPWNRPAASTLDVGSLGNANSFTLNSTLLPTNRYQGIIKLVDTTAGYGFPNAHFAFSVDNGITVQPTTAPQPTAAPGTGSLIINITANTARTVPGSTVIYTVSATNNGSVNLSNVNIIVPLVAGQTVDIFNTKTSLGGLQLSGSNQVTVNISVLAPAQTVNVTIYAAVSSSVGNVLSTQAQATADQVRTAAKSNIVKVNVVGGDTGRPGQSGGTGGTGGTGLPNTGNEFPYWLLFIVLALGGLAFALRFIRNRPEKALVKDE